jgi:hypothetical protein
MIYTLVGRRMFCLECRGQFVRFDFDKLQPHEEGVFLSCSNHEVSTHGN